MLTALLGLAGCRAEVGPGPAVPPRPAPVRAGWREPPRISSDIRCLRLADGRVTVAGLWSGSRTELRAIWTSEGPAVDFECLENPSRVVLLMPDGRVVWRLLDAHEAGPERPSFEARGAEWLVELLDDRGMRTVCASGGGLPVRCSAEATRAVSGFEALGAVRRLYAGGAAALLQDGRFVLREPPSGAEVRVKVLLDHVVRAAVADRGFNFHTGCLLRDDASVWCWGDNDFGQLGDGTRARSDTPVRVRGLPRVVDVVTSGSHACALDEAGQVWCWGRTMSGEAGEAATSATRSAETCPVDDEATEEARRDAEQANPCRGSSQPDPVHDDPCGRLRWNARRHGIDEIVVRKRVPGCVMPEERKDGVATPIRIDEIEDAVALWAKPQRTCGIRSDGVLVCWGLFARLDGPWMQAFPVKNGPAPPATR